MATSIASAIKGFEAGLVHGCNLLRHIIFRLFTVWEQMGDQQKKHKMDHNIPFYSSRLNSGHYIDKDRPDH